jgi:DNA segregation ATPase FtsK/SpoIIIE-like protein
MSKQSEAKERQGYDGLMTEQESIAELKKIIPCGTVFGVPAIQRHLRIGYNRAYRIFLYAVATGQARNDKYMDYRITWE